MTEAIIHRFRTEGFPCNGTVSYDVYPEGFAPETVERTCGFDGTVIVEIDAVAGEQRFTCPACAHVNVGAADPDLLHEIAPVIVVAAYPTVRNILMGRPHRWLTVQEVRGFVPTVFLNQLTESVIRSEFGALHDHGQITRSGDKARWDQ